MRQLIFNFCVCIALIALLPTFAHAQAPGLFNYQGVARDAKGEPLAKKTMSIQIEILAAQDATVADFVETHTITTNEFGLYTIKIGEGKISKGKLSLVKWDEGNKYVRVGADLAGGSNYCSLGTTQLLSVPYAMHANTSTLATEAKGVFGEKKTRATPGFIEMTNSANVVNSTSNIFQSFTTPNTNNIGINMGAAPIPVAALQVHSTSTVAAAATLKLTNATTGTLIGDGTDVKLTGSNTAINNNEVGGNININTASTTTVSAGKVGIGIGGTVTPTADVHVHNAVSGLNMTKLKLTHNGTTAASNVGLDIGLKINDAFIANTQPPANGTLELSAGGASVALKANNVGINTGVTATLLAPLHVNGNTLIDNGQIKITGGSPGAGKVLTSDAVGLASWQTLPAQNLLPGTAIGNTTWWNGTAWVVNNNNIYNAGANIGIGTATPLARLHIKPLASSNNSQIISEGTYPAVGLATMPILGPGTRMMWIPEKAAFRAGLVDGTQWDQVGNYSTAFGRNSTASGAYSFATGVNCSATNTYAIAMGTLSTASGFRSFAAGSGSTASGDYSAVIGKSCVASGINSIAFGDGNTASGSIAFVAGTGNQATAVGSAVFGTQNVGSGDYSLVSGQNNTTIGHASSSLGMSNTSEGQASISFGENTSTSTNASNSLAGGKFSSANAENSVALGYNNIVTGTASMAMGSNGNVNAANGAAFGNVLINNGATSLVIGNQNDPILPIGQDVPTCETPLFIIGNGALSGSSSTTSNVMAAFQNGFVGVGTNTPKSHLETGKTLGMKLQKISGVSNHTIDESGTIWYYLDANTVITLPPATGCENRVYTIVNAVTTQGADISIPGSSPGTPITMGCENLGPQPDQAYTIINFDGSVFNTVPFASSIEIISDGTSWLRIR